MYVSIRLAPPPWRATRWAMEPSAHDGVRRAFVTFAGLAIGLTLFLGIWAAIVQSGPEARMKELMPIIDARAIDAPLTAELVTYELEAPPRGATRRKLGDYPPGTILFLNFWASWCEPCVREIPSMLRLKQELADPRFVMVAVSYDEDWETLRQFFRQFPEGFPREIDVLRDPSAEVGVMLRSRFGTDKIPETYIIRDGRVLARFINERNWMEPAILEYFQRLLER